MLLGLGTVHSQNRSSREAAGSVASSFQLPAVVLDVLARSRSVKSTSIAQDRVNEWQM